MLGGVTYGPKNDRRKTVDWIVILPEAVLLVEVKSAIPTALNRIEPNHGSGDSGWPGSSVRQWAGHQLLSGRVLMDAVCDGEASGTWRDPRLHGHRG